MPQVEESGHHDLCFLSEPCSQDVPEHGFCSRQSTFCIHCERECICERLEQAENYARIAVMHTVDVDSYDQGQRDAHAAAARIVAGFLDLDAAGDRRCDEPSCDLCVVAPLIYAALEDLILSKGDQP